MSAPAFLKAHYQTNPNEIALAARALTKLIKGPRGASQKETLRGNKSSPLETACGWVKFQKF
jgi:hypothetical protein